jgi:hypothetical protein
MPARLRQILPAVLGIVLFLAALEVLRIDLRTMSWTKPDVSVSSVAPAAAGSGFTARTMRR